MAKIQEVNIKPGDTAFIIHYVTEPTEFHEGNELITIKWNLGDELWSWQMADSLATKWPLKSPENPYLSILEIINFLDEWIDCYQGPNAAELGEGG